MDNKLDAQAFIVSEFETTLRSAICDAYEKGYVDTPRHKWTSRVKKTAKAFLVLSLSLIGAC